MPTKVTFEYDESLKLWEVYVSGVDSSLEALQAFNAVLLTAEEATPRCDCNRAEMEGDGRYKISVGVFSA